MAKVGSPPPDRRFGIKTKPITESGTEIEKKVRERREFAAARTRERKRRRKEAKKLGLPPPPPRPRGGSRKNPGPKDIAERNLWVGRLRTLQNNNHREDGSHTKDRM